VKHLNCSECSKYLGSVAPGSRLSKGLVCTCTECTNKRKRLESGGDAVDTLRSIFGKGFNDG